MVLEWFQVCQNGFFDESVLCEVWLDDSKRFPPWRQRTGSGCLAWSLMCATTKTDWVTLRHSESIEKTRRKHGEPLRNTTSGLLPPRWNVVMVHWIITVQLPSIQNTRRRHHEHTTNHSIHVEADFGSQPQTDESRPASDCGHL